MSEKEYRCECADLCEMMDSRNKKCKYIEPLSKSTLDDMFLGDFVPQAPVMCPFNEGKVMLRLAENSKIQSIWD